MNVYAFIQNDIVIKRVIASSQEAAFEKLKFRYPNTYTFIQVKYIRKFKF